MRLKTGAEPASEILCFIFKLTMEKVPPTPAPQKRGWGGVGTDAGLHSKLKRTS